LLSSLSDLDVDVYLRVKIRLFGPDYEGTLFVKSQCNRLLRSNCPYFPAQEIWKSKAPTKACFLACAASKGKVLMEVMLKRIKFNLATMGAM